MKRKSDMVREINALKAEKAELTKEKWALENKVTTLTWKVRDAEENADIARKLMLSASKGFALVGRFHAASFDSYAHEGVEVRFTLTGVKEWSVDGMAPGRRLGLFLVDEKL